jgi:hypothetical protein
MKNEFKKLSKKERELLDALEEVTSQRNIITKYYGHSAKIILNTSRAKYAENAIYHAQRYMEANEYSAFVAVIYDVVTSELYATITRGVTGDEVIVRRHGKNKLHPVVLTDFPEGLAV